MLIENLALIAHASLTTLSATWLYTVLKTKRDTNTKLEECKKLVDDLKTVNNQNAETMKNIIQKMQDLETRLAMARSKQFNERL